jgi:hypothetical protein
MIVHHDDRKQRKIEQKTKEIESKMKAKIEDAKNEAK